MTAHTANTVTVIGKVATRVFQNNVEMWRSTVRYASNVNTDKAA